MLKRPLDQLDQLFLDVVKTTWRKSKWKERERKGSRGEGRCVGTDKTKEGNETVAGKKIQDNRKADTQTLEEKTLEN